jgi:predicted  nucleic acid-binding Zn-ribbon protein
MSSGVEKQISDLNETLQRLYREQNALEKKMMELDVNSEEYKSIKHEFNLVSETVDNDLRELWHLKNPDKPIDDVLVFTNGVIVKILPILLRIFDSIRRLPH